MSGARDNVQRTLSQILEKFIDLTRSNEASPQVKFINMMLDCISIAAQLFAESLEYKTLWLLLGHDDCDQEVGNSSTINFIFYIF